MCSLYLMLYDVSVWCFFTYISAVLVQHFHFCFGSVFGSCRSIPVIISCQFVVVIPSISGQGYRLARATGIAGAVMVTEGCCCYCCYGCCCFCCCCWCCCFVVVVVVVGGVVVVLRASNVECSFWLLLRAKVEKRRRKLQVASTKI
ncbi:unnamed protein product [Polarella glacialis]|uniref:Uncharacterized protein n=1 Tax=Polarella glacialis TaxID=89957 RepID=A0A813L4X4_POLGL|nr:unnamed protein product [Polarella glacialis]